jgi:hypothetical protein
MAEPQATERKEAGASFVFIGWFLVAAGALIWFFIPAEVRSGNVLLQTVFYLDLVLALAFLIVGYVKRNRGRKELRM